MIERITGDRDWGWSTAWPERAQGADVCSVVAVALLSGRCLRQTRHGSREIEACHLAVLPADGSLRLEFQGAAAVLFSIPELSELALAEAVVLDPISAGVLDSVFFQVTREQPLQLAALRFVCLQLAAQLAPGGVPAAEAVERPAVPLWHTVDSYLRAHLDEPLSLARLVDELGCSKVALARLFREHAALTPMQHLAALRVQHARTTLEQTSMAIGEIAHMVGYGDVATFSHFFKRQTGLSPSQARSNAHWLA
jgi:AraC-like DNA-binding protein